MRKVLFFLILLLFSLKINAVEYMAEEDVIEIVKLSSTRYIRGYSARNISNYGIEFYVKDNKINNFKFVESTFSSKGIKLEKEEYNKISNFIGYISENPANYRNKKINLIDVYNNLKYMDTKYVDINYINKENLIEIIKLSGKRKRKGYNARYLFKNEIVLYIDKLKVNNLNDFPRLFKDKNIELSDTEIADIHNFIGFIAEKSFKYKELKINLIDVYKNLEYMKE